ncbi:hypothetical protein [Microlunatus sp. GCM10028923]|uniref:CBU_0592 family membrane protein n=1 Tax=Microlunatus sp. GCM10028923 TaxID=3273400 RepID=UPI003622F91C
MGTIGTFVAYVMLTRGRLTPKSLRYASLNTVGGLLGGTAATLYGAWPSAAASFLWAALAGYSMITGYRRRRRAVGSAGLGDEPVPVGPLPVGETAGGRIEDGDLGLPGVPLGATLIDERPGAELTAR